MRSDPGFLTVRPDRRPPAQLIDNLLKPMAIHTQEAKDTADAARLSVRSKLASRCDTSHAPLGEDRRLRELNCQHRFIHHPR